MLFRCLFKSRESSLWCSEISWRGVKNMPMNSHWNPGGSKFQIWSHAHGYIFNVELDNTPSLWSAPATQACGTNVKVWDSSGKDRDVKGVEGLSQNNWAVQTAAHAWKLAHHTNRTGPYAIHEALELQENACKNHGQQLDNSEEETKARICLSFILRGRLTYISSPP